MSAGPTRRGFAARPVDPEQWIRAADVEARQAGRASFTARLTIDVTPSQRARIKIVAFERGLTVTDMLRELFAREFPVADDGNRS